MTIDEIIKENTKEYFRQYYKENRERLIANSKSRYKNFTPEQIEAKKKYRRAYWLKYKK